MYQVPQPSAGSDRRVARRRSRRTLRLSQFGFLIWTKVTAALSSLGLSHLHSISIPGNIENPKTSLPLTSSFRSPRTRFSLYDKRKERVHFSDPLVTQYPRSLHAFDSSLDPLSDTDLDENPDIDSDCDSVDSVYSSIFSSISSCSSSTSSTNTGPTPLDNLSRDNPRDSTPTLPNTPASPPHSFNLSVRAAPSVKGPPKKWQTFGSQILRQVIRGQGANQVDVPLRLSISDGRTIPTTALLDSGCIRKSGFCYIVPDFHTEFMIADDEFDGR